MMRSPMDTDSGHGDQNVLYEGTRNFSSRVNGNSCVCLFTAPSLFMRLMPSIESIQLSDFRHRECLNDFANCAWNGVSLEIPMDFEFDGIRGQLGSLEIFRFHFKYGRQIPCKTFSRLSFRFDIFMVRCARSSHSLYLSPSFLWLPVRLSMNAMLYCLHG